MPTDEDDHDDNLPFNHPERGETLLPPRRAQPLLSLPRSNPPTEGGHEKKEGKNKEQLHLALYFEIADLIGRGATAQNPE